MPGDRTKTPDVTLDQIRSRATVPVWHGSGPSLAGVLGVGRAAAYAMVERGDVASIRVGSRIVIPVPALLAMLGEVPGLIPRQDAQAADLRREGTSHVDPGVSLTAGPA